MSDSQARLVAEEALFSALERDLPAAAVMEARVRARLALRNASESGEPPVPKGVVLRFADWIGVRETAASIAAPVLLPLGLARTGTFGALVAKGALPKTVMSAVALPFAVLLVIGLSLNVALRKNTKLRGDESNDQEAGTALVDWWKKRRGVDAAAMLVLALLHVASPPTADMLLFLVALIAHALSAEHLSEGGRASRRTIAMTALNIGWMVYLMQMLIALPSDAAALLSDWSQERPPFDHQLLYLSATALTLGVVTVAAVQGRSDLLRPWKLLTEGTDLDLARFAGLSLVVVAVPGFLIVAYHYLRQPGGTLGERLWASRAILAWMAFCLHTVVLVKRAPLSPPNQEAP